MEGFEYVLHAKKSEIDAFFDDLQKERQKDYSKNLVLLNNYKEKILNEYQNIKTDYLNNIRDQAVKIESYKLQVKKLVDNKLCECGQPLRFVSGASFGDFWGCSDYKNDSVAHRNFMDNPDHKGYFPDPSVRYWPAQIRQRLGLPRSLKTGNIYNYILNAGYEDISVLYHGISEISTIYKLVDTRKKASEFEMSQYEILKKRLDKCIWQFPIKYKPLGTRGQKYAFPDIVGSDSKYVYIFECKGSPADIDIYQKELYVELISKMLSDAGDSRGVVFEFLFENK